MKIFGSFQALENLLCVQAEVPRVCNYEDILEFARPRAKLARPTLQNFDDLATEKNMRNAHRKKLESQNDQKYFMKSITNLSH